MTFYVVIRRKKDIGTFRKAKWAVHIEWIYNRLAEAIKVRDDARTKLPRFEFDVLHCKADGPKEMRS